MPRRRISVTARRPSLFCVHFLRMGAGQCRKTARGEKNLSLLPKTPGRPESGGPEPRPPPQKKSLGPGTAGAVRSAGFMRPDCEAPASFSFLSSSFFFLVLSGLVLSCLAFSRSPAPAGVGIGPNRRPGDARRGREREKQVGRDRMRIAAQRRRRAASPSRRAVSARLGALCDRGARGDPRRRGKARIGAESQGARPLAPNRPRGAKPAWRCDYGINDGGGQKPRTRAKRGALPPEASGLVAAFRRAAGRRRGGAGRRRECPSAKCPNEGRRRRRADKSSGNAAH